MKAEISPWVHFGHESLPRINYKKEGIPPLQNTKERFRGTCAVCNWTIEYTKRKGKVHIHELAVNCWKVLLFPESEEQFEVLKGISLETAKRHGIHGKWDRDGAVIVFYTYSQESRDEVKTTIYELCNKYGISDIRIPYRRGCKSFDETLGDWRKWPDQYTIVKSGSALEEEILEDLESRIARLSQKL